jgi:hypothetical protein
VPPGRVAGRVRPAPDPWVTFVSADGRVRFDHPAVLPITERPRRDADDPQLALHGTTPGEEIQFTLVLRVSEAPMPGYCRRMVDDMAAGGDVAVTELRSIELGGGRGYRREFRERGGADSAEYIAAAVEAGAVYVHLTAGYPAGRRAELRPVCERIVESLTLGK